VLVLTTRTAPARCGATVIDRATSRQGGALALRRVGTAWEVTAARPHGEARPWGAGGAGPVRINVQQPAAAGPGDATPRADDLRADD